MIRTSRPPSVRSTTTDSGDPLAVFMRPPSMETERDKQSRLEREAEAKRISDSIDEEIKQDREKYKKSKQDVKLLLLGQAESGKSTLQKQFQLMYNPRSLEDERLTWRVVIFYNIVRPILRILDALDLYGETGGDDDDYATERTFGSPESRLASTLPRRSPSLELSQGHEMHEYPPSPSPSGPETRLTVLRHRLAPLVALEISLAARLSNGVDVSGSGKGSIFVRSGWQTKTFGFSLGRPRERSGKGRFSFTSQRNAPAENFPVEASETSSVESAVAQAGTDKLVEEAATTLNTYKNEIRELWEHSAVQKLRDSRKLRLDEWAEYFLNNLNRVSTAAYSPTTEDILHARIQTMGVAEHVFDVSLHGRTVTWHLYDVGGARGQRHTWVPYFDDATAIIFLAPISAFDQYLAEDPRTNRVDDSLQLFKQICSNALLKNTHLVLFLNKTDVLRAKLERGVKIRKYITSYGDRPNDFDTIVGYFRAHFAQVHTRNNENKRVLYTHLTSVVDTRATQSIITNVRDSIFRDYLKSAALV